MKRIVYFIILLIALSSTTSCMQNNGYIGDLFGQWRLEYIEYDNTQHPCDTVFYSFQSDIIQVRKVIEKYDYLTITGLYTHENDMLKVNFYNHWGNEVTTEEDLNNLLKDLKTIYIDEQSPLFTVEKLDCHNMILQYNNRRYVFTKLN